MNANPTPSSDTAGRRMAKVFARGKLFSNNHLPRLFFASALIYSPKVEVCMNVLQ
jgi:hypothetical protein